MTNDEIVDVIWQLKQQVFWPHEATIAEDCQRAIATISHLEDRIAALAELVEQVTRSDSATVNVQSAMNARRWRDTTARLIAQLDQALAEARVAA